MYANLTPPKRRSRVPLILGIIGGAVLLLCGGLVLLFALAPKSATNPTTAGGNGAIGPAAAGLGQPVRDGKFEFTVTKVQCGVDHVGDTLLSKKPQGQYCLISVRVTNIGTEARTLAADNQHAYNSAGAKYDADSAAAIYLDDAGRALYESINPGNSVDGTVIFDIPKGGTLVRLELHDSALSGGVAVTLT